MSSSILPIRTDNAATNLDYLAANLLMDGVAKGFVDRDVLLNHGLRIAEAFPFAADTNGPINGMGRVEMLGWLVEAGDGEDQTVLLVTDAGILKLHGTRFCTGHSRKGFRWASESEDSGRPVLDLDFGVGRGPRAILRPDIGHSLKSDKGALYLDDRASNLLAEWAKKV